MAYIYDVYGTILNTYITICAIQCICLLRHRELRCTVYIRIEQYKEVSLHAEDPPSSTYTVVLAL